MPELGRQSRARAIRLAVTFRAVAKTATTAGYILNLTGTLSLIVFISTTDFTGCQRA
jgi:hypothetical protein